MVGESASEDSLPEDLPALPQLYIHQSLINYRQTKVQGWAIANAPYRYRADTLTYAPAIWGSVMD